MAMVVKNNMSAVRTLNTLNQNSSALQKSLAKVSSGMKINSAQDDASGYAISERMRVQIRSLDQANQNTQNASSLMKTAEGAVGSTMEILKTLKEKAINAATDTNTDADRATIQKELDQFIDQIDDNALTTFNGKYLVDGSKSQEGDSTYTAMTNQSLSKDTTATSKLTALKNRNDESLEIKDTDFVTVSYVQDGKTYTTKFGVKDENGNEATLQGIFAKAEEIDTKGGDANGHVFAAGDNKSVQAADPDKFPEDIVQQIQDKKAALDTAKTTYQTYVDGDQKTLQQDIDDAKAAQAALDTSDDAKRTAAETAIGTFAQGAANSTATGLMAGVVSAAQAVADEADYSNGDTGLGANKASIGSNTSIATEDNDIGNAKKLYAAAVASVAYTDTANKTAAAYTNFRKAVDDLKAQIDIYDANPVVTDQAKTDAAKAVKDAEDAKATRDKTEKDALDKAQAEYDEVAGPAILTTSNVGVNASGDMVTTNDGEVGLTITAAGDGIGGQISGVTISITDSEGNVKKSANAALDAFKTTIYAKNPSDRNELTFHTGAAANQAITVGLDDMRAEALGLKGADGSKVSVATQDKANAAVAVFDNAIQKVLDQQATIGAIESRLEYTSNNLTTSSENVQAAESTIRDADMAKEMTTYTKNNVLLQAAQSMLAQANQNSSAVLSLLQ